MSAPDPLAARLLDLLADDETARRQAFPGPAAGRQPVHTVYVSADRFDAGTVTEWGAQALSAMEQFGPLPGVPDDLAHAVRAKLAREPVEDLRVDFEDGYGHRSDAVEDADAERAGVALADLAAAGIAPAFCGIRFKSFEAVTLARGVRTVRVFLESLLTHRRRLPDGFRLTLPKVTSVLQVQAMVLLCTELEAAYGIDRLRFELQVETPQAILGPDGTARVAAMVHAAAGRCAGLHYGTYDYSAAVGIAAAYQSMEHPAADYAKAVMQVAAAQTGVPLSDGSTNVLPVGTAQDVQHAWTLHSRLVRRSLERGFYQGWDLHPVQLPTRFAATFAFYTDGMAASAARLRAYLGAQASGTMDEPATAMALAGFLLRGVESGALDPAQVQEASGTTYEDLMRLARRA